MVSAKTVLGAIALAATTQTTSAFVIVEVSLDVALGTIGGAMGAAGGLAGGISTAVNNKRDAEPEPQPAANRGPISRVKRQSYGTKYDWEQCHSELEGVTLNFEGEDSGTIVVSGMPPTCMNLATVLTGQFNDGNPVPLSNNAIRFTNLSNDELNEIQANLNV